MFQKFLSKKNKNLLHLLIIILLLTTIINYAKCDDDDYEDTYTITGDSSGCNSEANPSEAECQEHSDNDTRCCFVTFEHNNQQINKCIGVQRNLSFVLDHFQNMNKTITIGNYENIHPTFNCSTYTKTCGTKSPSKYFQCREHSSIDNTCCYVKFSNNQGTECLLNNVKWDYNENKQDVFGTQIVCISYFNKFNLFILLFAILLF